MESKKEIRRKVLAKRDALHFPERMRSEALVTERILGHQWYYAAKELLVFVSYGSEISTGEIMADAFKAGKKVFVPKVEGEDMVFYRILQDERLKEGYKGILEPEDKPDREVFVYTPAKAGSVLMLMPGAAFDPMRNRIGYGKGFYDRYLRDKEDLHTIAIGFECQMVAEIKAEATDIKPMQVICL